MIMLVDCCGKSRGHNFFLRMSTVYCRVKASVITLSRLQNGVKEVRVCAS